MALSSAPASRVAVAPMWRLLLTTMLAGCSTTPGWLVPGRSVPSERPAVVNPALDAALVDLLRFDAPLIGAAGVLALGDTALLLDAREPAEYDVAHLPGALRFPPSGGLPAWLDAVPRERPVVVYCSVGFRSERVARELSGAGCTEVYNLYGSIFDWVERGLPVVDSAGRPTDEIHTYNRRWGRLVTRDRFTKVYD